MKKLNSASALLSALLLVFAPLAMLNGQPVKHKRTDRQPASQAGMTTMTTAPVQQPSPSPTNTPAPNASSPKATPAPTPPNTATTPPTTNPQRTTGESEEDVVRITSNLVQVDAVVHDKRGQVVTDLRPEDVEVLVDGKPQQITNFSYVSNESRTVTTQPAKTNADKNAPPAPPVRLRPEQVRRTMALVVDDLGTSFESMHYVRRALKKFVDEQMQPDDLVAIMRTSAGMGALQQFTSDKRLLYAAIEHIRWYPSGRGGVSAFAAIEGNPFGHSPGKTGASGSAGGVARNDNDGSNIGRDNSSSTLDDFREQIFSVGTLGALNFIVRGLKELPGRKSIVLFSDGFVLFSPPKGNDSPDIGTGLRVFEALRRLIDLANRASVVVYTIDARGLPTLSLTAADDTSRLGAGGLASNVADRSEKFYNSQQGLSYLADQTGGFFVRNTNDIVGGVRRVLDDQQGYYLIGYRPDEATFKTMNGRLHFNKFQLKLSRPGLSVRTRSGFYGVRDDELRAPVGHTRFEQMIGALSSPFASGDISLRLTSLFSNEVDEKTSKESSYLSSLIHIDASRFKFTDEPDGWHKAVMDIVALTFGDKGNVIDEVNRTETVRARAESYDDILRNGLIYTLRLPLKKPGAYQLRVAVRDAATEKLGTASQFVEAPDIAKNRLALSGIIMHSAAQENAAASATAPANDAKPQDATGTTTASANAPDPSANPAVRRFQSGATVEYFVNVYNAKLDRAAGQPQLQTQLRLFRDGQPVFTGKPLPFHTQGQADLKRLIYGARFKLGTDLSPGEYVLQIVVSDPLAPEKYRTATQWTDFEIVNK